MTISKQDNTGSVIVVFGPDELSVKDMHPEVKSGEDGSRPIGAVVLVERWWRIGHGCRRV